MNMKRTICPPRTVHAELRQKLTPGEQVVLDIFDRCLAPEWEIYVQPHLNGLRPDFVLLNPKAGIAVFEVKDWNLRGMRYFTKSDSLWAEKDGKEFCIQKDNPLVKVNFYKREIFDLYCPRVGSSVKENVRKGWASITAGVIFPFADTAQVKDLMAPFLPVTDDSSYAKYQPISGKDEILNDDLLGIFPECRRTSSMLMTESFASDLRGWLVEPDFSATQREPLSLDRNQHMLATSRTQSGYRRIKGPAGSGKSLVLAARAAKLMNEGKSVLIVTYNITLWHYLRDLVVRDLDSPGRMNNVEFVHFHLWCKRVCYNAGLDVKYEELVKIGKNPEELRTLLNEKIPALAEQAVSQLGVAMYDAILVDEGQDYQPYWWNVLRKVCRPEGEMILVADATQDVYGSARAWTDDVMRNAGFPGGRWAQLNVSYRLPPVALDMARRFAQQFLPNETTELPEQDQAALDVYPCTLRWVQCTSDVENKICASEIIAMMKLTDENELANADITFLTGTTHIGASVVAELNEYKLRAVDTFSADKFEQRRQKMGFYMGDARIKATTLYSFKGWEARLLVVYITQASDPKALALIYAGLTRLKRNVKGSWLTVVCSAPELATFGKTWPSYKDLP